MYVLGLCVFCVFGIDSFLYDGCVLCVVMGVVKNSRSGRAVLFVDERGFVYMVSRRALSLFINGVSKKPLPLSLLPGRVESDRFVRSRVLCKEGSLELGEAFERGFVDKSFYSSLVSRDVLGSRVSKEDKVRGDSGVAVDFDL